MANSTADFPPWNLVAGYRYIMSLRDTRLDGYFLMDSPFPTLAICAFYVYFVKSLGPRLMKDRPAFDLKKTIVVYNILQVAVSIWIVYKGLIHAWLWRYNWRCQPIDYSESEDELMVVKLCWLYFFCKITELLDTIFFVLRKKFDQITHLHVIHHTIMPSCTWWGVRYVASGHGTFFGLLNTFVHIIMYTYYLLAAMGPRYQKYLWWKKHLTLIQMIQFAIVFLHTAQLYFNGCNYPRINAHIMIFNSVMFFSLFSNFYIQAYIKRRRLPAALKAEEEKKAQLAAKPSTSSAVKSAPKVVTIKATNKDELSTFQEYKKMVTDFMTLASGVCTIDQNGLYTPDHNDNNKKKL